MVDPTRANPDDQSDGEAIDDRPVDDADALMPVHEDPPEAPPVDVDDREGGSHSDEPIVMRDPTLDADGPEVDAAAEADTRESEPPRRSRWNDTIDELVPLPQEDPYHDDDATGDDPFDAQSQVDMHVPSATGDADETVDDFSTEEELDVDNAPGGHNPDHDADGVPEDDESTTFTTGENASGPQVASAGTDDLFAADGTTRCPICGNETDALRFCGHCGGPLTESRREVTGDSPVERLISRAEGAFEPLAQWTRPGGVRAIVAAGLLLILIALLANSGAMALVIGASILPVAILFWCRRIDVFENEPWYIIAGFAFLGIVTGALLGWLGAFTATRAWFDEGVLNYGAAGFGGQFAKAAGTAPFMVWLVCGILIPALALGAIIAGPLLMRNTMSLRNEIMDGLTLAAAMGGGYAVGSAIVFVAPLFGQSGPTITASGWTLTAIGITILRPIIWTLAGGMLGAAGWRYLISGNLGNALVPAVAGIAIPLVATLLAIQLAPTGLWAEVILGIVAAIAAAVFYQRTLVDAVREDRRVLGSDNARLVCPNCHRVTPKGQFCAHCGQNLSPEPAPTPDVVA